MVPTQDLRSPDARTPYSGVPVEVVAPEPVVTIREVDGGFDWGDAAVGAGALLSLALLTAGGAAATRRHRPAVS